MRINKININFSAGLVESNGVIIAPLDLRKARAALLSADIEFMEFVKNDGWITIGVDVCIFDQKFGMNLDFQEDRLSLVWLSWYDGIVGKKGYSSSEEDLIKDKNKLSRFLSENFQKPPEISDYSKDVFNFEWGYVSASASLQSVIVTIGLEWNNN